MSKEEKTIIISCKCLYLWVFALIVAICCFVGGWMLANYAKANVDNNIEKTEKADEHRDMVFGGMSYEVKENEYW